LEFEDLAPNFDEISLKGVVYGEMDFSVGSAEQNPKPFSSDSGKFRHKTTIYIYNILQMSVLVKSRFPVILKQLMD